LQGRGRWVVSEEELHHVKVLIGRALGEGGDPAWKGQQHDEDDLGWDDFGAAHQHQFQNPAFQAPQYPSDPPVGHNYVPYDQFQTLVYRVGEVECTLDEANYNIDSPSASFYNFMGNYQHY
jgi:hypothetical protein